MDVGCGPGEFTLRVARKTKSVTGIDACKVALEFDVEKDRTFLEAVRVRCMTERGIETPVHRVVLTAKK